MIKKPKSRGDSGSSPLLARTASRPLWPSWKSTASVISGWSANWLLTNLRSRSKSRKTSLSAPRSCLSKVASNLPKLRRNLPRVPTLKMSNQRKIHQKRWPKLASKCRKTSKKIQKSMVLLLTRDIDKNTILQTTATTRRPTAVQIFTKMIKASESYPIRLMFYL